jgi:hypothetical protein
VQSSRAGRSSTGGGRQRAKPPTAGSTPSPAAAPATTSPCARRLRSTSRARRCPTR